MRAIEKMIRGGVVALALGALLVVSAAPAAARADAAHDVSQSTLVISEDGSYAVTGSTTTNHIVVNEGVTATVTLNNVTITGVEESLMSGAPPQSPIDLAEGATLTLILAESSTNTLTGGAGTSYRGAPGIHVPDEASLIIQGSGSLSVTGGSYRSGYGAPGIGGNVGEPGASGYGPGENCGTVIILTENVTATGGDSSGSDTGIDIGGGDGSSKGNDGQGIRPGTDGTYTVYGDMTLPCDVTIPAGATVTIPSGTGLTVPEGVTLTNNGTILVQGGTFTNNGTVEGNQPTTNAGYEINYGMERIFANGGYELSATNEATAGGSHDLPLTPGKDVYIRQEGSTGSWLTVHIPERPQAPKITDISISYSDEKLTIAPNAGISAGNLEYTTQLSQSAQEWDAVPESLALSEMGWTGNQMYLYFRIKATETSFASEATTTDVQIPPRPAAPTNAATVTNKTENTIMTSSEAGQEYRCGTGDTWGDWQTASDRSITFENLSPGTEYTIQNRYPSGRNEATAQEHFASFTNSTTSVTLPSITTTGLETGYVGVAYSAQLEAAVAEGTNVTWSLENSSLPAGLTLNGDGTISGTPTAAGQFSVTVKVTIFGEWGEERASKMGQLSIIISKSDAELGGLTVSGNTGFDGHFQYGDVITVTFTPERSEGISTHALVEGTASLTYANAEGEEVTLATAAAQADGSFELSYDTGEKKLPIGEDLALTVSYGGSHALNPAEETVTLALDQAYLRNIPTVTGSFMYGETLTVNYTPQDDETVTYRWYRVGDDGIGETITGANGPEYKLTLEDIGTQIYASVVATDDWHFGSKQSIDDDVVAKATGSIEIACDSVTYGTAEVAPFVTSNTNEGADVTFTYTGTAGTSYGPSTETPEDAGTYTVTATVAETATHTEATSDPVTFTIDKAALAAPQGLNLTSDAPGTATACWDAMENASGYAVQLYKDGAAQGDAVVVTGTSHEFSIAEPGSYTVKVSANGSDNYDDGAEAEAGLTFFSVSFATNGGGTVVPQIVAEGGKAIAPADPVRAGHAFGGWYSDESLTQEWDFGTSTVDGEMTLYARWAEAQPAAHEETGGDAGHGDSEAVPETGDAGARLSLLLAPLGALAAGAGLAAVRRRP